MRKAWIVLLVIALLFMVPMAPVKATAYEDFTSFTEVSDENNYLTQNATHARWNQKSANDSAWIIKDYGTDHFSTNFIHDMDLRLNQCDAGSVGNNWYSAPYRLRDDSTHWLVMAVREAGTTDNVYDFVFKQKEGGSTITKTLTNSSNHYAVNVTLYLRVTRSVGSAWALYIYLDVGRTSLIESDAFGGWDRDYDQLNCTHSVNIGGDTSANSGGWLRFLNINEFQVTYFFTDGGTFETNGDAVNNGSSTWYGGASYLKWGALPVNRSYIFLNFTWTQSNMETNPHNYTGQATTTVWLYFDATPTGDGGNVTTVVVEGSAGGSYALLVHTTANEMPCSAVVVVETVEGITVMNKTSDLLGNARFALPSGRYTVKTEFRNMTQEDTFLMVENRVLTFNFNVKGAYLPLIGGVAIVVVLVIAFLWLYPEEKRKLKRRKHKDKTKPRKHQSTVKPRKHKR